MVALSAPFLSLEPLSDDAGKTQYGKYADKNIACLRSQMSGGLFDNDCWEVVERLMLVLLCFDELQVHFGEARCGRFQTA